MMEHKIIYLLFFVKFISKEEGRFYDGPKRPCQTGQDCSFSAPKTKGSFHLNTFVFFGLDEDETRESEVEEKTF